MSKVDWITIHIYFKCIISKKGKRTFEIPVLYPYLKKCWLWQEWNFVESDLWWYMKLCFFRSGASSCSEDEPHLQCPPLHVWKWVLPRWRVALPHRTQDCWSGSEKVKMKRNSDEKVEDTYRFDFLRMSLCTSGFYRSIFTYAKESFLFWFLWLSATLQVIYLFKRTDPSLFHSPYSICFNKHIVRPLLPCLGSLKLNF